MAIPIALAPIGVAIEGVIIAEGVPLGVIIEGVAPPEGVALPLGVGVAAPAIEGVADGVSSQRERLLLALGVGVSEMIFSPA